MIERQKFFLFLALLQSFEAVVNGGICWLTMGSSGRCQLLDRVALSKEECCQTGAVNAAWSSHNEATLRPGQFFYWESFSGGADKCEPCHVNCDRVSCSAGKKCVMRDSRPQCVCSPDCSQSEHRHRGALCGTDGRNYDNHCALLRSNCRKDQYTEIDYFGKCKRSCDEVQCARGKHCVVDQNALPHCVMCTSLATCQRLKGPHERLCGADGVTYESLCHYRRAACIAGRAMSIAYTGECKASATCADITCGSGMKCLLNSVTNRPQCVTCSATTSCTAGRSAGPVCGTDGRTYANWCTLREEACRNGYVIETQHFGECGTGIGSWASNSQEDYYDDDSATALLRRR